MLKSESGYDFPLKIPRWLPISVEVKAKVHTITTKPFPLLLISPLIPLALRSLHPSHSTFLHSFITPGQYLPQDFALAVPSV